MSAQTLYEKALRSYLLTKYTPAANTCLKAISALPKFPTTNENNLRLNIWTLYLNIASTLLVGTPFLGVNVKLLGVETVNSLEQLCRSIWKKVKEEGFGGVGSVDARLVSACLVMDLKLNQFEVAREISEDWFASLSDSTLDHISANNDDQVSSGYSEIVDIYITRILPGMDDFKSAKTFLQYNSVLSSAKKEKLHLSIQDQQDYIQNEREKKIKLEETARLAAEEKKKEIETAKKLEEASKRSAQVEQEERKQEEALVRKVDNEESSILEKKYDQPEQSHTQSNLSTSRAVNSSNLGNGKTQIKTLIQNWMGNITPQGVATSGATLIFIFTLFTLLRGQRGRLTLALQGLMNKLWQTIKMGTKVTYM